jgi:hypothetical protein
VASTGPTDSGMRGLSILHSHLSNFSFEKTVLYDPELTRLALGNLHYCIDTYSTDVLPYAENMGAIPR